MIQKQDYYPVSLSLVLYVLIPIQHLGIFTIQKPWPRFSLVSVHLLKLKGGRRNCARSWIFSKMQLKTRNRGCLLLLKTSFYFMSRLSATESLYFLMSCMSFSTLYSPASSPRQRAVYVNFSMRNVQLTRTHALST